MSKTLGMAATLAFVASLAVIPGVSAQGMAMAPHPAHIHAGTCPAPGDVVAPLADVSFAMNVDAASQAGTTPVGQMSAIPVEASITTVKVAFADIVGGQHAVVVHKSADEMGTYILCGDIGGMTIGATDLPFGLGALNDSGATGVGWLHDNGDGTTSVTVFVVPPAGAMAGPMGSPEASPAA